MRYTKENSRVITFRVSIDEHRELQLRARQGRLSTYIRNLLFRGVPDEKKNEDVNTPDLVDEWDDGVI